MVNPKRRETNEMSPPTIPGDFHVLILCPAILLKSFTRFNNCLKNP